MTHTKDEALKLALEALENVTKDYVESRQYKHNTAITAINEALAQPEQEPVAWEHHEYRPYGAPGEMRIHAILASQYTMPDGSVSGNFQWLVNQYKEDKNTIKLIPLYTAAQRKPQYNKTEMNCFVQNLYDQKMREGKRGHYETMFHVVHRAIEAAHGIKEKNT